MGQLFYIFLLLSGFIVETEMGGYSDEENLETPNGLTWARSCADVGSRCPEHRIRREHAGPDQCAADLPGVSAWHRHKQPDRRVGRPRSNGVSHHGRQHGRQVRRIDPDRRRQRYRHDVEYVRHFRQSAADQSHEDFGRHASGRERHRQSADRLSFPELTAADRPPGAGTPRIGVPNPPSASCRGFLFLYLTEIHCCD